MKSLSPQVVFAAKLPILNPNEFDLWKMMIEQYFLMTNYSLWEVILNGDSPIPTRVIDGVVQPVAPTTAEQRLARKNELKAWGTLLMALPNKHQLKFNIHKDAKTLMEAIEKRLKIYEAEVKSSSTTSPTTQNIAFVSSQNTDNTNESVSVVASVSAASTKINVSALFNVDTLSDDVIYSFFASQSNSPQLDNDNLKQLDAGDGGTLNGRWLWHFARECMSPKDNRNKETQRRNVPVETSTSNALVLQCDDIKLLKLDVQLRDNALVDLKKKFEKAQQERDELKLKLDKFQTSLKDLSQLLASQTNDKTGLGYDNQVFNCSVFDCDEMFSSKSDVSMPASPVYDRYKSGEGYHAIPPPYTGTFMPPKPDLIFHDAPTVNETVPSAFNVKPSTTKPTQDLS
uniref:Uncharacterized protein n=1 Tax=Tanacetum cinerariifolium TaxID=118510 RepID=A0A6L2JEX7_TANCI|nr:hypothetical protein [Tanacetum cinerariifolium]